MHGAIGDACTTESFDDQSPVRAQSPEFSMNDFAGQSLFFEQNRIKSLICLPVVSTQTLCNICFSFSSWEHKMLIPRAVFTLLNLVAGVAMVSVAMNIQDAQVSAQESGGCGTEENPSCEAGEACCDGVCFDPLAYMCDCEGNLVPIEE